ncbi:YkyA family protein [Peribacillus cavernae]|uniref:YkyA family protein n=1 Tax=Peribacillus cavernae TaxID=1674310 RepID=UPI00163BE645|nr:YkyA family protein [Peribacillus cavernae]MDQ0217251.1 rubrerythrin [Peribacillus cavernae]
MGKQIRLIAVILLSAVLVSGCNGSPEEQIHSILEETVQQEKGFEDQQTPIAKSETKEKQLYDQIIKLGMKEFDQIVKLSDDALKNIQNREKLIEKEHKSIQKSEEEFNKIDTEMKDIDDKKVQQQAEDLKKTMESRYAAHDRLYKSYKESLSLDKQLYELFKNEDLKMEELQAQIDKINTSYQKVLLANEQFNKETELYNQEKKAFYKSADIKIANNETDNK